jgi:hypothetical protein
MDPDLTLGVWWNEFLPTLLHQQSSVADHNVQAEGRRGRGHPQGSKGRVGCGGGAVRNFGIDGAEDAQGLTEEKNRCD